MRRVFHVPSHLSYVSKLASDTYVPVPSPSGAPLRVSDLLALGSWDFFDVLHLHTVELTTDGDLASLGERLQKAGKGLVLTLHDLMPNIETDGAAFQEKTHHAVQQAASVVTLTHASAEQIRARFGVEPSVIPHGYAVAPGLVTDRHPGADGLLVFGALRTNRDLLGLVRAWRLLPPARMPLRILLRSVGTPDQRRYASELAELAEIAGTEPDLKVEITTSVLSAEGLVDLCRKAAVLVLPYTRITHSGQLELSRDLGLAALAPDVPTVRAQLRETAGDDHPCVWFPTAALRNPMEFACYLEQVSRASHTRVSRTADLADYRTKEHERLLDDYEGEYQRRHHHG